MDCKFLIPIFTEFHKIFKNTMKELFVNKCFCDEASLYIFIIEISEETEQICFVKSDATTEFVSHNKSQKIRDSIDSYLAEKYENIKYTLLQMHDVFMLNQKFRIAWVFTSEAMDHNSGRFLFRCVCEELAALFNGLLEQIKVDNNSEENMQIAQISQTVEGWSVSEHYLIQQSIWKAANKTCRCLQKLYTPLNLPLIIQLSGEYYERSECRSNLVFLFSEKDNDIEKEDYDYYIDKDQAATVEENRIEFIPENIRLIRKLLEIAQNDLCLVLRKEKERKTFTVLGICKEECLENRESFFPYIKIKFRNHMQWDFLANECYIFSYKNAQYKIDNQVNKDRLIRKFHEYFGGLIQDYGTTAKRILEALQQNHGTMVTIMNSYDAQNEARRLGEKNYGILNSLPDKQENNILKLSNIDGSVIMDISGKIYGIGMILDGKAESEKGNLARGSRFNSIIKYNEQLHNQNIKAMTFIISEDGTLDIQYS